jgi:hypothetical protein
MIETLMVCAIGFLAGCLLVLMFVPFVHQRAVRLTMRDALAATPMTMAEIRAGQDGMRAQFATAIRGLEARIEELNAKAASQLGEVGRKSIEVRRLKVELDRKAALILALQAREQVRKSIVRRIVKLLLFIFIRSGRRPRRPVLVPQQGHGPVHAPLASVAGRAAA